MEEILIAMQESAEIHAQLMQAYDYDYEIWKLNNEFRRINNELKANMKLWKQD